MNRKLIKWTRGKIDSRKSSGIWALLLVVVFVGFPATAADVFFKFALGMGSTKTARSGGVAVDAPGNIYTAIVFTGTVDVDPGPGTLELTNSGGLDLVIQKLDLQGNLVWAKTIGNGGGTDWILSHGITVDSSGNVYGTGGFGGTIDFDPGPGVANMTRAYGSGFVWKLDSDGNFVWAKATSQFGTGYGIAVDGSGNVYTVGCFVGTVDFDPGPGTANLTEAGGNDLFIWKLDSTGTFVWAKRSGGTELDCAKSVVLDAAGNVYTAGHFRGVSDFDPGQGTVNLNSGGEADIFVQKLDSSGNFVWAKTMGGIGNDRGFGIAVDTSSNVYTYGNFEDTVDFDAGPGVTEMTGDGIFVQKLDSTGSFLWAKSVVGARTAANPFRGSGIAVDTVGDVYMTGSFWSMVDFNPGVGTANLTSDGHTDAFVLKLDSSGNYAWVKAFSGPLQIAGTSIAVHPSGDVFTLGGFWGIVDFDPGFGTIYLDSLNMDSVFVHKLSVLPPPMPIEKTGYVFFLTGCLLLGGYMAFRGRKKISEHKS